MPLSEMTAMMPQMPPWRRRWAAFSGRMLARPSYACRGRQQPAVACMLQPLDRVRTGRPLRQRISGGRQRDRVSSASIARETGSLPCALTIIFGKVYLYLRAGQGGKVAVRIENLTVQVFNRYDWLSHVSEIRCYKSND